MVIWASEYNLGPQKWGVRGARAPGPPGSATAEQMNSHTDTDNMETLLLCNRYVKLLPYKQGIFFHVYFSLLNLISINY